ncbi:MAG: Uma2 family endonuclease [Thermoguttaceae bacterium]
MTMLIEDPRLEEEIKEQRRAWGADHHDEVWEGVYFMAPLPNDEHQRLVSRLTFILEFTVGLPGLGEVRPGVNLAGPGEDWLHDYRAPDVVVFLCGTAAENRDTHWTGAADFVVEITNPGDRTYEKIPFYSRLGVRELLVVNRQSWTIEIYRRKEGSLEKVGESRPDRSGVLTSEVVPLAFRLLPGDPRPKIEVAHGGTSQRWVI